MPLGLSPLNNTIIRKFENDWGGTYGVSGVATDSPRSSREAENASGRTELSELS